MRGNSEGRFGSSYDTGIVGCTTDSGGQARSTDDNELESAQYPEPAADAGPELEFDPVADTDMTPRAAAGRDAQADREAAAEATAEGISRNAATLA